MEWGDSCPGFVANIWGREELVVIVPNEHQWAKMSSIPGEWLHGMGLLSGEPDTDTGRLLQWFFGDKARTIGVSMQLGSTEAVKSTVPAGLCISMGMVSAVNAEHSDGRLRALAFYENRPFKQTFVVLRKTEAHRLPPALEF